MSELKGIEKPEIQALPQMKSRITFLYLEHCKIKRDDNAIKIISADGTIYLPAAMISVLLLGPGTSITHQAVELITEAGVSIVWVGENGVRFYASGRSMARSASLLIRQAKLVSNTRAHLDVARRMYQMRFPDEDVSMLTMQQLRGREGSRIRKAYRAASAAWNVEWSGREYDPNNYFAGDAVNKSLSAGNSCLYGLAHAVIMALGCSPGLGFVHVGHDNSFVYDIADLYKADITIPIAFEIASKQCDNIGSETRRKVRDVMVEAHLLERMVKDICTLLNDTEVTDEEVIHDEVFLWNGTKDLVRNGFNYAETKQGEDH